MWQRTFTVVAVVSTLSAGCTGNRSRHLNAETSASSGAAVSTITPKGPVMSDIIDEPITVINTLSAAVEVSVVSNLASGESTTIKFGPIAPDAKGTEVVKVQSGGSFVVQAHWSTGDGDRSSSPFTADLQPGLTITPVTLTLAAAFPGSKAAQWKMVEWEEAK